MFRQYRAGGISLIPCVRKRENDGSWNGKMPAVKEWQRFSHRLPTEEEANSWHGRSNTVGAALVMGLASNICCIDIDGGDRSAIEQILPFSPVRIKGKKGVKILYRIYGEGKEPPKLPFWKKRVGEVDILLEHSLAAIPPGLHSEDLDGNKLHYEWEELDLLEAGIHSLPVLEMDTVSALSEFLGGDSLNKVKSNHLVESDTDKGRWNTITTLASRLIREKTPVDTAVRALIEHDRKNYSANQYFLDQTKGCATRNDIVNAYKFYGDMLVMSNRGEANEVPPLCTGGDVPTEGWGAINLDVNRKPPDLPLDHVPFEIRDEVSKISESTQAKPQMACFYLLGLLGACCGNKRMVQPYQFNKGYVEGANIYIMLVANSGERKTQITKLCRKGLLELQTELRQLTKNGRARAKKVNPTIEAVIKRARRNLIDHLDKTDGDPETEKVLRDRIEDNEKKLIKATEKTIYEQFATPEKLYQLAEHNPFGMAIEFNEWSSMYKQLLVDRNQALRQFLLNGWDGHMPFSYRTKHQGEVSIDRLCLSVIASCQDDMIQEIFKNMIENNDGLMQRFLLVGQNSEVEIRDVNFSQSTELAAKFRGLYRSVNERPILFTPEATQSWMAYQEIIKSKQEMEKRGYVNSWLSKQVGLVLRFCNIIAQLRQSNVVDVDIYNNAQGLINWCEKSLFCYVDKGELAQDEHLITLFQTKVIEDGTSVKDLYRSHSKFFGRTEAAVLTVIKRLRRQGVVKTVREGKSYKILINPNL